MFSPKNYSLVEKQLSMNAELRVENFEGKVFIIPIFE